MGSKVLLCCKMWRLAGKIHLLGGHQSAQRAGTLSGIKKETPLKVEFWKLPRRVNLQFIQPSRNVSHLDFQSFMGAVSLSVLKQTVWKDSVVKPSWSSYDYYPAFAARVSEKGDYGVYIDYRNLVQTRDSGPRADIGPSLGVPPTSRECFGTYPDNRYYGGLLTLPKVFFKIRWKYSRTRTLVLLILSSELNPSLNTGIPSCHMKILNARRS